MKLNKLLTPMLGLATVSTIVAPIATSCTTETSTDHVKISNKSEEVNSKAGLANYLFVLDSNDYDVHGFKVTTTVNSKDTTGVVDSDFTTTWEIDGDHLLVHVQYEGEEVPENDIVVKLNIHIYYGTEWNKTFDVKFGYEVAKGIPLDFYEQYTVYYSEFFTFNKQDSYTFSVDCSSVKSIKAEDRPNLFECYALTLISSETSYEISFENIVIKLNGKTLTEDKDYYTIPTPLGPIGSNYIYRIEFYPDFIKSIGDGDTLTFECEGCHIFEQLPFFLTGNEIDSLENGIAQMWCLHSS